MQACRPIWRTSLGVLTLTIPVAEQAKPRRVQIAAQPSQPQPVEPTGAGTGTTGNEGTSP
jgi:hypothetical protein